MAAGDPDQLLVERDTCKPRRRVGKGPEFVVSGNPDHLPELRSQPPKAPVKPLRAVGHVPRQDQPVVGKGLQILQLPLVFRMGDVQVGQRP